MATNMNERYFRDITPQKDLIDILLITLIHYLSLTYHDLWLDKFNYKKSH